VVYNILDWAHYKGSKLINIGIANTMDMPEKLDQKIQSRMGKNRIVFKAYSSEQIQEIIKSRIE
jgi:Cdc6-like AAA superfamily ATPase